MPDSHPVAQVSHNSSRNTDKPNGYTESLHNHSVLNNDRHGFWDSVSLLNSNAFPPFHVKLMEPLRCAG